MIKNDEGKWIDENGNTWNNNIWCGQAYTEEEAIKASKSLVNCINCYNCKNMINCIDCSECKDLVNCIGLMNRQKCINNVY